MRFRKLGSADLEVSEISLGSWLVFSGGVEFEQTRTCTDAAFEADINFFDTANVHGQGAAESAWGEILSGRPRDSYVLATKVWGQMSDDPADQGLTAAQIAKQIDASLARLKTDYVDLYGAVIPAAHRARSARRRRSSARAHRDSGHADPPARAGHRRSARKLPSQGRQARRARDLQGSTLRRHASLRRPSHVSYPPTTGAARSTIVRRSWPRPSPPRARATRSAQASTYISRTDIAARAQSVPFRRAAPPLR